MNELTFIIGWVIAGTLTMAIMSGIFKWNWDDGDEGFLMMLGVAFFPVVILGFIVWLTWNLGKGIGKIFSDLSSL